MARKQSKSNVPDNISKVFKEVGLTVDEAVWNCHGTWVAYHKALEVVGAVKGVKFAKPEVIYHDPAKGEITIYCEASLAERTEWTYGEVSKSNNKNSYPWAMVEKRAKDRLILKLVNLHGYCYSEEESDDFKPGKKKAARDHQPDEAMETTERDPDCQAVCDEAIRLLEAIPHDFALDPPRGVILQDVAQARRDGVAPGGIVNFLMPYAEAARKGGAR